MTKSILRLSVASLAAVTAVSASAEESVRYIVKLHSPSLYRAIDAEVAEAVRDGLVQSDVLGQNVDARPTLLGTRARVAMGLKSLNMIVVENASPDDVAELESNPDVAYVEKEFFIQAPVVPVRPNPRPGAPIRRFSGAENESTWGLENMNVQAAWDLVRGSGQQGQGIRVMIIDTGIDKDHADIRANFEAGKNFVTTRANPFFRERAPLDAMPFAPVLRASEAPSYDYFDQIGHGTHVAGTIAAPANGVGVMGVAPKAKILAGRVCSKLGCSSTAIIAAIDWATQTKADVVNMSLGGPMQSRAQAEALARAEAAGVTIVAASGNDGKQKVSFPGATETVLAVGAINSKSLKADFSNWGPELDITAPGVEVKSAVPTGSGRESRVKIPVGGRTIEIPSTSFVGSPEALQALEGEIAYAGLGKVEDFRTSPVRGKVALLARGEIPFAEKVKNAIDAGATAVAIYNNVDGLVSGALTQDGSVVAVPVVAIEKDRGEELKRRVTANEKIVISIQTLKTDYAAMQGTSMASPHVAGLAVLVKAANPSLKPAEIRALITRTARKVSSNPNNEYGAGLADAAAAVREALR